MISRKDIAAIKRILEEELQIMQRMQASQSSLSTKNTTDFNSNFDDRKYCIDSILTHIQGLDKMEENSAEANTSVSVINDCYEIYKKYRESKPDAYEEASDKIREIIFSDLTGNYTPTENIARSKSELLPKRPESFPNPVRAKSDPLPPKAGLRSFSVFKRTSSTPASSQTFDPVKVIQCDLIALQIPPTKKDLGTLPVTSKRAYVRCGDDLYYVNKTRNSIVKLKDIDAETMRRFDDAVKPNEKAKSLTKTDLDNIAGIIGVKGHNATKKKEEKSADIRHPSPK